MREIIPRIIPEIVPPPDLEPRFAAPPELEIDSFDGPNGIAIRWARALPAAPRATMVLLPGFTEYFEVYHETMRDLLAQNIAVYAMDWPSQGGSGRYLENRQKVHARGFEAHLEALRRLLVDIVAPGGTPRPLTLVGHSLGGHLVTRFLEDVPGMADAAALSAPGYAVGVDSPLPPGPTAWVVAAMNALGFSERWALGAGPWEKQGARRDRLRPLLSTDPVRAAILTAWTQANPSLRLGGPTWGFGRSFVQSAARVIEPDRLAAIAQPVLIGSPRRDEFTDPALHDEVAKHIPNCRLMRFEDARHCLFLERATVRDAWMAALAALATTGRLPR